MVFDTKVTVSQEPRFPSHWCSARVFFFTSYFFSLEYFLFLGVFLALFFIIFLPFSIFLPLSAFSQIAIMADVAVTRRMDLAMKKGHNVGTKPTTTVSFIYSFCFYHHILVYTHMFSFRISFNLHLMNVDMSMQLFSKLNLEAKPIGITSVSILSLNEGWSASLRRSAMMKLKRTCKFTPLLPTFVM